MPADKILQLTNVARPWVGHHPGKQFAGKWRAGDRQFGAMSKPQILCDGGQIFQVIPQGRHIDRNNDETMEKVPPKVTHLYIAVKIACAGADDTHFLVDFVPFSRCAFIGLGKRPRQLLLQPRRQLAHLLERKSAKEGREKCIVAVWVNKTQSALQRKKGILDRRRSTERGTVDAYIRPERVCRVAVDELGQYALSNADLTLKQDGHGRRRDANQLASKLLHDFGPAEKHCIRRGVTEKLITQRTVGINHTTNSKQVTVQFNPRQMFKAISGCH